MGARKQWSSRGIMSRRYAAQRGRCYLCGGRMAMGMTKSNMPNVASRDHVFPRSTRKLYFDHNRNILLAHRFCNNKKGDREPYACEVLFLEVNNELVYGYDPQDDPQRLKDWIPIPVRAKDREESPYDGEVYDIWFRGKFWIGYRDTNIEWYQDAWCDADGYAIELTPGMKETHYMIPPTSIIWGKEKAEDTEP